jgi:TatD DNase family protein
MHWYTGPLSVAEDALAGGLWFSINPAMTVSPRSASLLALLPPDRVLLETDGPFARWSGRPSRPPDLHQVTKYLARLWKLTPEQTQDTIINNQRRLAEDATDRID